jgi:hypothetical protein
MRNLLRKTISEEEFRRIFAEHPPAALLPREGDAWTVASRKPALRGLLDTILRQAEEELDTPLPELTDALYADFTLTGTRVRFESLWFERRRRLARAAIATLVEADPLRRERFRKSLRAKAETIFQEVSWAFPAHVKDPSGKDPMTIDLFAAETANQFAELLTIFGASLPADLVQRTRQRLRTQFFENYLARDDFHWLTGTSNWNAVCHQGVLGAALGVEDDAGLLARMFVKASRCLPNYLKGFTPDGATAEGPGYWSYGFGWFTELNAQLEQRTGGELSVFHDDPLIPLSARFGPTVALTNGHLVNFADCAATGGLRAALLQYLAERLNDPQIANSAAHFWHRTVTGPDDLHGQRSDLLHWTRLILRFPEGEIPPTPMPLQDHYFPDVAWLVIRSNDNRGRQWEFAAKAGHNEEHHNHNDVGSYLVHIDGERMILEIGAPEYVKAFFRAETRYQFLAARSLGHSVPLINGIEQRNGAAFCGQVVEHSITPHRAVFALDFTQAYPAEAGLVRGLRRFAFDKDAGMLRVTDEFELRRMESLESAIITPAGTRLEAGHAIARGKRVALRITPAEGTVIRELQTHEYKNHSGGPEYVTRVVMAPQRLERQVSLGYTMQISSS